MIGTPAALSSFWPKARSSSSLSVYGEPPTTGLPALRSSCAQAPIPSTSSNTTTSAQSTSLRQSSHLAAKPSAIPRSSSSLIQSLTRSPSRVACHAMSPIRPSNETKRIFEPGIAPLPSADSSGGGPLTPTSLNAHLGLRFVGGRRPTLWPGLEGWNGGDPMDTEQINRVSSLTLIGLSLTALLDVLLLGYLRPPLPDEG